MNAECKLTASAVLLFAPCLVCLTGGCANSKQSQIDDAYRRGEISSLDRREMTRAANEQVWAKQEASRKQFEQQPTGKLAEKMVYEQPVDEPDGFSR